MVTSGSFGFISYNTREFLSHVLDDFIADGIFSRAACWFHESLGAEKNHFHCWVEPLKKVDTSKIGDRFVELSEDGAKNSIAIRPRCKSDWCNAYLYGIHDADYLAYKGLAREEVNIITDEHIYRGDFSLDIQEAENFRFRFCLAPYQRVKVLVEEGCSLEEVYCRLRIPFAQMYAVKKVYILIRRSITRSRDLKSAIEEGDIAVENDDGKSSPFCSQINLFNR